MQGSYDEYLNSDVWYTTVRTKISVDGRRQGARVQCQKCLRMVHRRNIEIHHLTYARVGDEHMRDLKIVCRACHRDEHPEKQQDGFIQRVAGDMGAPCKGITERCGSTPERQGFLEEKQQQDTEVARREVLGLIEGLEQ